MPAEIEIVILEEVVPEFEPIEPICQNSTAPVLPPVSENGITGTWDPPVVSTTAPGTFEFTFQPDNPLQCAVSATISITVNPSVIPLFDAIGPLCQGDEAPELPDESLNGISGTWNPAVIQTSVPGTFVFIFTPVELEECGVMTTLEVSVNAPTEPLFDPIGPLSQGSVAPALPSVSLNGVTGTWAPPVIDTSVPGTYEFVFTPDEGQCATTAIMNITVLFDLLEAITGSGEHCVGDAVVVPLAVDNFIHVNTFQLKLNYNVDKLECEGYINAHPQLADSLTGHVNVASGVITLNWHGSAPVTFSQSEIVADLVFTPKEPGQGGLSWYTGATESFFLDPYNLTIPAEFHTAEISIYDPPQIMIESLVQACEGQEVIISGIALGTHPPLVYEWVYPNGHTDTAQPHFAYVTPSNQGHFILRVTDAMHCTDQKSVYLKVSENPVAAFHGSDTLSVPQGYLLDAGSGMESYLWNTGEISAAIVIDTNGMYSVSMVSPAGCQGKDSVYVRITSELPPMCLYIPNAFTPNGDELNDTFKAIAACPIRDFKMLIFNRWGEELYEAYDISQGWDGTKNGVKLPGDAYVYKITYRESNIHDGPERMATGVVILLK
jgi:gliding motility-associated-like protein